MNALLPCPHCGGEARVVPFKDAHDATKSYQAQCIGCLARTFIDEDEESATYSWNRRTPAPHTQVTEALAEIDTYCKVHGVLLDYDRERLIKAKAVLEAALSQSAAVALPADWMRLGAAELKAGAELLEQMRGVYPGDPTGSLGEDAELMRALASSLLAASPSPTTTGETET